MRIVFAGPFSAIAGREVIRVYRLVHPDHTLEAHRVDRRRKIAAVVSDQLIMW